MVKYEVTTKSKCIIITCFAHLKKEDLTEFSRVLTELDAQIPSENVDAIILDFIGQTIIDHHFLKFIAPVLQAIRQHGKKLFAVNVPAASQKVIKDNGLSQAIQMTDSLDEILNRVAGPAPKVTAPHLDVNFINPFIKGTLEAFRIQGLTEAKVGKPQLKSKMTNATPNYEICGVIGYNVQQFGGYIAICFPEKVFTHLMSKMLGKSFSQITPAIEDGAGEFLNVICGQPKTALNEKSYGFELSSPVHVEKKIINDRPYTSVHAIPTVMRGKKIKEFLVGKAAIVIPFELEEGSVSLEISTREENTAMMVSP